MVLMRKTRDTAVTIWAGQDVMGHEVTSVFMFLVRRYLTRPAVSRGVMGGGKSIPFVRGVYSSAWGYIPIWKVRSRGPKRRC